MFSEAEQQIADDLLAHTLDLFRLDASLRGNALSLLQKMQKELRAKLGANNPVSYTHLDVYKRQKLCSALKWAELNGR